MDRQVTWHLTLHLSPQLTIHPTIRQDRGPWDHPGALQEAAWGHYLGKIRSLEGLGTALGGLLGSRGSLGGPWGVPWVSLGVPGRSLSRSEVSLGVPGGSLSGSEASLGVAGGPWVVSWGPLTSLGGSWGSSGALFGRPWQLLKPLKNHWFLLYFQLWGHPWATWATGSRPKSDKYLGQTRDLAQIGQETWTDK